MYLEQMTMNLQLCLWTLQVKQSHTLKRLLFCAQWLFDFPLWTRTQSPILDILINGVIFFLPCCCLWMPKCCKLNAKQENFVTFFFFFLTPCSCLVSLLTRAVAGDFRKSRSVPANWFSVHVWKGVEGKKTIEHKRRERTEWKDRKAGGRKVGLVLQPVFYTRLSFHLTVFTPVSVAIARLRKSLRWTQKGKSTKGGWVE